MLAWVMKTDQRSDYHKLFKQTFLTEMTSKQNETTKQIKDYCAKYAKDSNENDLDLSNLIVSEKYKLVYCSVPKVACTVWKRVLADLEGINVTKSIHDEIKGKLRLLSNYTTEDRKNILKTYKKFMFVRDPFERLLSAYRNCFWGKFKRNHDGWKFYRRGIRDVLAKRSGLAIDVHADNTTFEQFATYLVLRWREGGLFQVHWREQHKLCHPCHIQFDYVGHYETLVNDALFILKRTKLENKVFFPEWRPSNTSALMKNYYSTLSLLRIRQVWNIYKEDFELFGYTYPGSVQIVVDNLIKEKL
ncbi:carbohydrate sulfotransferase 11-like [Oculina patagonica]